MRIALLHASVGGRASGGGGSRLMLELGVNLQSLGHDIVVLCHDFEPGTEFADAGRRLDIRSVRSGPFTLPSGKRSAMRRFWRDMEAVAELVPGDVDVINAHEWPALRAGRIASGRRAVPFVWTRNDHTIFERAVVPGARHDASRSILARMPRAVVSAPDFFDARRAAAIVVLDEASCRSAERAFRRGDVHVVRCGPADQFFTPPDRSESRALLKVPVGAFLALGVGVMNPHRRFEDLIEAAARVEDSRLIVQIIGSDHVDPAYADFVEGRLETLELADRVRLVRRAVPDDLLRAAYAAADLFVFPNDHRQSWGLAPLEALASGTPAVITREAGVHEVLAGRSGVTVVDPHSPLAIAGALRAHLDGSADRDTAATRAWLAKEMTGRRYAERMAEIFADVNQHLQLTAGV